MNRLRFTLAQLMVIVLFIGFGFAALRSGSVLWASAVFTLTVAVLSSAILAVMARRGRARMTWAGFALFGWVYLGTAFGPWADGNGVKAPPYVTKWLFDFTVTQTSWGLWVDNGPSGEMLFTPPPPMFTPPPPVSSPPPPVLVPFAAFRSALQFRQVGHCLAAILFGLVGAGLGRLLAMRDEQPNP